MQEDLLQIAKVLDQAAQEANAIDQISKSQPLTLAEAYQVQSMSIDQRISRGETLLGYKLGFTSKAKMEQMGVHELIWGRLTSQMDLTGEAVLNRDKYIHPRVEPEIAFLLSKDIDNALDISNVYDYIDSVAPALEVIDSRYKNFKFSLEDVIADNCSSTAYVIGKWESPSTRISEVSIQMNINGQLAQSGNSNDILDGPINSLIEASKIAQKYQLTLKKGMVILAGAATPASFVNKGDNVEATFGHLGRVYLQID